MQSVIHAIYNSKQQKFWDQPLCPSHWYLMKAEMPLSRFWFMPALNHDTQWFAPVLFIHRYALVMHNCHHV